MADLHETIAKAVPQIERGKVWCIACGRMQRVDGADALRHGWPKCCGATMAIDSPRGVTATDAIFKRGMSELSAAVEMLRDTGRFVDEEGEATDALADLLTQITDGVTVRQGEDKAPAGTDGSEPQR